ncbi:MAG: hypothetical protein KKI06_09830 [Euryarchaeota archaeon]|nr:hypothetical protein [Euryarchaeota archaeon]MBU4223269.1 hypothetical protein [Euryarchaeota archaeon]MCG2738346.1 hypothetical protein [Candidatus Methanoperedenaceae archaeon]
MAKKNDLKVHDDIIKNTDRCKKDHSCLSGLTTDLCKVEMCVGDKIHFIKCLNEHICNYRIPFGYSFVCTCPVRKELYNRYKV